MSLEFIERYGGRNSNSKKGETNKIDLKKLTHLFMNGKFIQKIGDLPCAQLKVLYLHNNLLKSIENLSQLTELTHLYLQWNKIRRIDGLDQLKRLKKLFLGNNEIECLENLNELGHLEELHLERQRLSGRFCFDEKCLEAISSNLRILNLTGLGLKNINSLQILYRLEELIASENNFECPVALGKCLNFLPFLRKVDLTKCPAQRDTHYREKITAGALQIEILDKKFIPRSTRNFIKRFEEIKANRKVVQKCQSLDPGAVAAKLTNKEYLKNQNLLKSTQSFDPTFNLLNQNAEMVDYQSWNSLIPKNVSTKKTSLYHMKFGKHPPKHPSEHATTTTSESKSSQSLADVDVRGRFISASSGRYNIKKN